MKEYRVTIGVYKFDSILATNSNEAKRIAAHMAKDRYSSRVPIEILMRVAMAKRV